MSIKNDLTFVARSMILENCSNSATLLESGAVKNIVKFVKEEATYEQLLNLAFNPQREKNYLPSELIECVVGIKILHELKQMMPKDLTVLEKINLVDSIIAEGTLDDINKTLNKTGKKIGDKVESTRKKIMTGSEKLGKTIKKSFTSDLDSKKTIAAAAKKKADAAAKRLNVIKHGSSTSKIWQMIKDTPETLRKELTVMKNTISDYATKHPEVVRNASWVAGGLAVGAAMLYVYRKYYSQSAQLCKNKTGDKFKQCVAKAKISSERKAITAARNAMGKCNTPACRQKYISSIKKHEIRLKRYTK